jgi:hypothetical protein
VNTEHEAPPLGRGGPHGIGAELSLGGGVMALSSNEWLGRSLGWGRFRLGTGVVMIDG